MIFAYMCDKVLDLITFFVLRYLKQSDIYISRRAQDGEKILNHFNFSDAVLPPFINVAGTFIIRQ